MKFSTLVKLSMFMLKFWLVELLLSIFLTTDYHISGTINIVTGVRVFKPSKIA